MRKKGFTLVEILIVIGVMAIISATLIGYNQSTNKKLALLSDRAKVVGVLQRAKSFALEKRGDACAFGVYFEKPGTMIIFGDLPSDDRCAAGNFDKKYDEDEDEKMEEIFLDSRISFFALPGEGNSRNIVFIPPYLETEGGGKVKISNGTEETCIEVGTGGQIYSNENCN